MSTRFGHRDAPNGEWGRKARKEEDRIRGLNNQARRAAIEEEVSQCETNERESQ